MEQAQTRLAEAVMRFPGVVGVAIGLRDGAPCFKVYVVRRTRALAARIPTTFEGYPVEIEESGQLRITPGDRCT